MSVCDNTVVIIPRIHNSKFVINYVLGVRMIVLREGRAFILHDNDILK